MRAGVAGWKVRPPAHTRACRYPHALLAPAPLATPAGAHVMVRQPRAPFAPPQPPNRPTAHPTCPPVLGLE